jgi:hypothetical protein
MFAEIRKDWKQPPELRTALPREIRLAGHGIALTVIALLFFAGALAAYIGLSTASARGARESALLQQQGTDADAVITRLWRRSDKERQPMVDYQFEYGGKVYGASVRAPVRIWRTLETGGRLPIRFVPSRPGLSHPREWPRSIVPAFLAPALGISFAAAGGFMLLFLQREKRLLAEGQPAPAIVTRIGRTQHGKVVYYDFQPRGSSALHGRTGPVSKAPGVGDVICVLYDPEKPRRNRVYPMRLVRLDDHGRSLR